MWPAQMAKPGAHLGRASIGRLPSRRGEEHGSISSARRRARRATATISWTKESPEARSGLLPTQGRPSRAQAIVAGPGSDAQSQEGSRETSAPTEKGLGASDVMEALEVSR